MIGIGNLAKEEEIFFGSRLYFDIAKVEEGGDESSYLARYVLDARELELAYRSDEEAFLFDIDYPLIGDDPHIEVVVDPDEVGIEPEEDEEGVLEKSKKPRVFGSAEIGKERGEDGETHENGETEYGDEGEVRNDIEPVTVNDLENFFSFALSTEMVAAEIANVHKL